MLQKPVRIAMTVYCALASFAMAMPAFAEEAPAPNAWGEARLARLTEGLEPGEPVDCIFASNSKYIKIVDGTAITYRSGGKLFVNRPVNAHKLKSSNVLIIDRRNPRLCNGDVVGSMQATVGYYPAGAFQLGPFIPYAKPGKGD